MQSNPQNTGLVLVNQSFQEEFNYFSYLISLLHQKSHFNLQLLILFDMAVPI